MRKESEKKSVVKSIKMTPEQERTALKNAEAKGMSFSAYAVDRMIHSDNSITPEIVARIQEIINCADRAITGSENLMEMDNMKREVDKLWECLK